MSQGKLENKQAIWTPILAAFLLVILFLSGCKPEGGGGLAGTVLPDATGGFHPGYETLIIDESSITVSAISDNSAVITWQTNFPSTTTVEYGKLAYYTNTTPIDESATIKHERVLSSLSSNQNYHFRCISTDAWKNLAQSKDHTFTTAISNSAPKAVTLNEPIDIQYGSVILNWTVAEDLDFKEYLIYYDQTSEVTTNSQFVTSITEKLLNTHQVTNLNPETDYWFKVFVRDTGEISTGSNVVTAKTIVHYTPPEPVKFVTPSNITTTTITLNWEAYTGNYFSNYMIYKSEIPGFKPGLSAEVTITSQSSLTWEDTGLTPGTTYYYKIYVTNQGGYIGVSDEASFTTYSLGQQLHRIENIYSPTHVVLVKNELFISSYSDIKIFNPDLLTTVATIPVAGMNARLAVTKDEETVYTVSPTYNQLREFDVSERRLTRQLTLGDRPRSATISRDESRVYMTSSANNYLYVVDRTSWLEIARVDTGNTPWHAATAINQNLFAVANSGTKTVSLISSDSLVSTREVTVGNAPNLLLTDLGGEVLYAANNTDGTISRISLVTGAVVDTTTVGSDPTDMLLMDAGRSLLVCLAGDNKIQKYALPNMTLEYEFSTGKDPRGMALSRNELFLYVVNYEEDTMTIHAMK